MSETEKAPRKKRGKAPAVVEKPEAPKNDWRSQKYEIVPIDSIREREDNANEGDKAAISESVEANGFYGAILVGPDGRIVVGNHRWAELRAAGETECPIIRLSVEDERAIAILIADNETRAGAKRNDNRMADLLARLPSHRGLGIKAPDVAALIERARPRVSYLDTMRANSDAAAAEDGGEGEEEPDEGDLPDDAEQDLTDFDDNDGGPREDEPAGRVETPRIPLSIVLTNSQERRWAEYKKSIGERRDGDAFLVLLAAVTRTNDGQ
jgi:hypothetical protein